MDTLTFVPYRSTRGRTRPRVLVAQFGDGYEQASGDGRNSVLRDWDLVYLAISKTKLGEIDTFFSAQGGWKKFLWTQPAPFNGEGARAFVCREWDWIYEGGNIVGLTASLLGRPLV
jgi:phage-related protein